MAIKSKEDIPAEQYLLLDGIPRSLKQISLLEKYLKIDYVIVLDVKNISKLIDRIKKKSCS